MGPSEKNTKIRDSKFEVKTDRVKPQTSHIQKKAVFVPRPMFYEACGALMGQKFSCHHSDNFKSTLDNI